MIAKNIAAHFMIPYIRETETFIYDRLMNHDRYAPFVITDEPVINEDKCPFDDIISLSAKNNVIRKMDVIYKKTLSISPFFVTNLKGRDATVAHAHYGPVGAAVAPSCTKASVPLVVSFYGIDASSLLQSPEYMERYNTLFKTDRVIISVLSEDMKIRLCEAGCPEEKVRIHHLAVDTKSLSPSEHSPSKEELKIVSTGRLVEKKAMDKLVVAFSRVSKSFPNATLHIYGDGPLRNDVEKKIVDTRLTDKIITYGHRNRKEVLEAISSADIFALFSVTAKDGDKEGTPTVLIEAGSFGIPSVSTFHAGIPEVVINNETGLLSEESSVEAFSENLRTLLSDRDIRRRLGHNARKHIVDHFDIKNVMKEIEKDYDSLTR